MRSTREVSKDLGNAAGRNWVPLTLLGAGVAWLVARQVTSSRTDATDGEDGPWEDALQPGAMGEAYYPDIGESRSYNAHPNQSDGNSGNGSARAEDFAPSAAERFSAEPDGRESLRDRAQGLRNEAGVRVGEAKHRVDEAFQHTRERLSETGAHLREEAEAQYETVRRRTGEVAERARVEAGRAVETADRSLHEQPLLYVGLGVLAGVLLGAMVPTSKAERRAFGRKAHRARVVAESELRHGVERARSAVESGLHEAGEGVRRGMKAASKMERDLH
ncbi:hypothetical protein CKO38_13545 [Rhodospirillum rubrum]|uniref:DUF883 family protein n=1 Tax=Rhodospirillum rubrum TaxID=1085 RepID=UPI001908287B|nr:hypothetical protein [Rhodospirillum rubrum]MBK1665566.1 hypothetical protein [Rhodospirillum rubrum]MBK1677675.1 hypothetical protein [Rhodospirillum rubrum]